MYFQSVMLRCQLRSSVSNASKIRKKTNKCKEMKCYGPHRYYKCSREKESTVWESNMDWPYHKQVCYPLRYSSRQNILFCACLMK